MGRYSYKFVGASIAALLIGTTPAYGQDAGADEASQTEAGQSGLDTIYVTARKRSSSEVLQRTPISATAFGAEQLSSPTITDLSDVGRQVPGASLQPAGSQKGAQNFNIRGMGVSGTTPSDEPSVGIFQDGVYWGSNYGALNEMFDVESVEILRGPQGTLFGRNVTGGAVLVRSARPTDETLFRATAGYGLHDSLVLSSVINGAAEDGVVAGRLAVQYKEDSGVYTHGITGENIGDNKSWIVRPSVKFQASDVVDITLIGEYYSLEGDPGPTRAVLVPGTAPDAAGYVEPDKYYAYSPETRGYNDIEIYMGVAEINWELGPGVLTSITGYRDVSTRTLTDFDGTPFSLFTIGITNDQNQVSTELRYAGDISDSIDFTAGFYYFDQEFEYTEARNVFDGAVLVGTKALLKNSSYGFFGEVDFELTDGLTLTAGLRYTEEKKTARNIPFASTCYPDPSVCTVGDPNTVKDNNVSPKALVSYQISDRQLVFGSYTRGFRSGGFALRGTPIIDPYRAETVDAFEIGYKGDLFEDTIRLNASLYYSDYKDLQRNILRVDPVLGSTQSVFNAGKATVQGAEIELTAVVSDNFKLQGNYSYTDTDYDVYESVADPSALRFARIPRHLFGITGTYTADLANGGTVTAKAGTSYTGSYFYDDPNLLRQDSYNIVDASLTYSTPDDRISVTLFGSNLTNAKYSPWGAGLGSIGTISFLGSPRRAGIRITASM